LKNNNLKENYKKVVCIFVPIFAVLLVLDLVSKYLININLAEGESASFLPGFIKLTNVHNNGAAWNSFAGNQVFLIIISCVFLLSFGYFYYQEMKNGVLFHIASSLIVVGAFGNLIDRLAFGYVRDMLHFEFWLDFPVFNVADMCICIGVPLLILFYIIKIVKEKRKKNEKDV